MQQVFVEVNNSLFPVSEEPFTLQEIADRLHVKKHRVEYAYKKLRRAASLAAVMAPLDDGLIPYFLRAAAAQRIARMLRSAQGFSCDNSQEIL